MTTEPDAAAVARLSATLGRCQGMTRFRPVYGTYGGLMGDVKDRMRCTNTAVVVINGVALCGIHSFGEETTRRQLRCAWERRLQDDP